ncbi:MAG: tripartite tricarboxylate transporter substrate binding protein [Alphaproteobacteria bacterium]|nr:tripartite tricarboxylate transporter substrate binding protein [Alphaproteobacteria bacterium]
MIVCMRAGAAHRDMQQEETKMTQSQEFTRRSALGLLAGAAAPALLPASASAQNFPAREIKVVCAFPAGSGADVLARFYADGMKGSFNQPIIVENRVGGGGLLAQNYVARSKPDGYTLFIHAPSSTAANMSLFKNPGVDVGKTLECLGAVSKLAFTVAVRADAPWKTLQDLVKHLQQKGDKGTYGITAPTGQVGGALMCTNLGLKTLPVQYRTGPDSLNDLTSGNLDFAMYDPTFALAQVRGGRVRLLAIASRERMQSMPDVPTMKEQGAGDINAVGWWGMLAPTGIPGPVKTQLSNAFQAMANSDRTKQFLAKLGTDSFVLGYPDAHKLFIEEIGNWRNYIRIAKIEPRG